MTKTVENRSIKGQTLQGCHYFVISQKNLKRPKKGHGRSIFYNHEYPSCRKRNLTDHRRLSFILFIGTPDPEETKLDSNSYTQGKGGKTEMSLINFTLANPNWQPPPDAADFINNLRQVRLG